jgi:hypothetical protein
MKRFSILLIIVMGSLTCPRFQPTFICYRLWSAPRVGLVLSLPKE